MLIINTWFVKWYNIGIGVQHPIHFNILVYHYKINVLQVLYQKYEADSMLCVTLPKNPISLEHPNFDCSEEVPNLFVLT